MKKKLVLIFAAIFVVMGLVAKFVLIGAGDISKFTPAEAETWPTLSGTTLLGDDFTMPQDFDLNLNLVLIGFKRSHQEDINTWTQAFKPYELEELALGFYEVPIVYEMEFTQRFFLNNAMKFGVKGDYEKSRTVTVYLDRSKFLKSMNMDEDNIYALLINRAGKILWIHKGVSTEAAMEEIRAIAIQDMRERLKAGDSQGSQ